MLNLEWTVTNYLDVSDGDFDEMIWYTQRLMGEDEMEQEDAIQEAVRDFLAGQEDIIFYSITQEVTEKIEDEVEKRLSLQP